MFDFAQNFGVSFSIISVITGIPSLFLYGLVGVSTLLIEDLATLGLISLF